MRIKAKFTLFPRKLPSGRVVYYYQCYDQNGKRLYALSTGFDKKTLAYEFCLELYRTGKLIPEKKAVTFGEYAKGWFDKTICAYLKWCELTNPISENTIQIHKNSLNNHLKPFFETMPLTDITQETVEKWFVYMAAKKVKDRSGNEKTLKNSSIHCGLFTLKTMMAEAARRKLITHNLIEKAREPKVEEKELEILKLSEVKALFPARWEAVWDNKLVYLANKYMAFTGMRLGEMLGLRGEYIHSDYIRVCGQYGKTGFTKTKTGESRDIPITGAMRYELQELIDLNGGGYLIVCEGYIPRPLGRYKGYVP